MSGAKMGKPKVGKTQTYVRTDGTAEITIELESRDAYSAVALGLENGSGLATQECYRCLTTTSELWHEYGKLKLPMCNGCVVLMDRSVCGWYYMLCGKGENTERLVFTCALCRRPVHEGCQERLRAKPNPYSCCIVCELKLRIKHRDHASHLSLISADLSSLLNRHIFSYSRFFQGPGPRPHASFNEDKAECDLPRISNLDADVGRPRGNETRTRWAKENVSELGAGRNRAKSSLDFVRNENNTSFKKQSLEELRVGSKSSLGLASPQGLKEVARAAERQQMQRVETRKRGKWDEKNVDFDKLLSLTAKKDVKVRESSAVLDMQQEFRAKWDKITSQAAWNAPARDIGQQWKRDLTLNGNTAASIRSRNHQLTTTQQVAIARLEKTLIDIGLCYFTRPFRDGREGLRFLSPHEMYFMFAQDFGIVPQVMSRSECGVLIYHTIGDNPEFSDTFRELNRVREEERRKQDERGKHINRTDIGITSSLSIAEDREDESTGMSAKEGTSRKMLGQALLVFMYNIADFGRIILSPSGHDDLITENTPSKYVGMHRASSRVPISIADLVGKITEIDDPEMVSRRLAKYPTLEQLEQNLLDEINEAEMQRNAADIEKGRMAPYPLEEITLQSEQMYLWQVHLAEIFEFFVNPLDHKFTIPEGQDDSRYLIGKCFRTLDCDQDGIISSADAIEALIAAGSTQQEAERLADVLMWTVPDRVDEDGVTWDEFEQTLPPRDGEEWESIGACWRLLLEECKSPAEKTLRAVNVLQRDIGFIWIESNGKDRDIDEDDIEWDIHKHMGLGAIFSYDKHGHTVVHHVARPGPADGKLWGGDVIVAINGKDVESQGPGHVIALLIAAGKGNGNVELKVRRGEDFEVEVIARSPPPLPPRLPAHLMERDELKMAQGDIGLSSVLKMMRMLGVMPSVISESELIMLCKEIKPGHRMDCDGEMKFSFDEFQTLIMLIVDNGKFYGLVKKRITSQVGRKAFRRLIPQEQRLGAICIVMQLPRRNVPGGVAWIKLRYYRYVALEMIRQQERLGHSASFSDMRSNIEVRIISQFRDAKELILGDGLSQYFEACTLHRVAPDLCINMQLLSMSPLLKLDGHKLKDKEALAMMGALRGNHHVQTLILKNLGLNEGAIRELYSIFSQAGPLSLKMRELDLSNNPIGVHKAIRNPPTGHGAIGDIVKMINISRVLSDIRLCGVGLGDRDARALCDVLIATKGSAIAKVDVSNNNVGDRSSAGWKGVILKCDRLSYLNLTSNCFSPVGGAKILDAVADRERAEEEEKLRIQRMMMDLHNPSSNLASCKPAVSGTATPQIMKTNFNRASSGANQQNLVSSSMQSVKASVHKKRNSAFDDILAVRTDVDGTDKFGPREGMYNFDRLNNKTLTQTVEYLEDLRTKTKWDGVELDQERKCERRLVVLVDMRADGTDVHVSPKKKKPTPAEAPMAHALYAASGSVNASQNDSMDASMTEADNFIDDHEYLELKALLIDLQAEMTLEDRLSALRMRLKGRKLRVLQAWEQMLPFQASNLQYAATRFLYSRLGRYSDAEKLQALQNVFSKPRNEIFIPEDSRLSARSAPRRRTRTPVQTYLDPGETFRNRSPDETRRVGLTYDSEKLMATVSAKLRMRAMHDKIVGLSRTSLPLLTKPAEESKKITKSDKVKSSKSADKKDKQK